MAYYILDQAGQSAYNRKKIIVDTEADVETIPVSTLAPGSTVFVIDSSKTKMLNTKHKWVEVTTGSGGSIDPGDFSDATFILDSNY